MIYDDDKQIYPFKNEKIRSIAVVFWFKAYFLSYLLYVSESFLRS